MKILILHGWNHNKTYWINSEILVPEHEVYIPDLPGFGDNRIKNLDWTINNYADWVDNYIKIHNLNNICLIGHSFGGRIAAELASRNPEYLSLLILYAAPCIKQTKKFTSLIKFLAQKLKRFKRLLSSIIINPELNEAEANNMELVYKKAIEYDQKEIITKIQIPTLLLWGENDEMVSIKIADLMSKKIKKSNLVKLPLLTHNAHLDNPQLFYGTINKFFKNNL